MLLVPQKRLHLLLQFCLFFLSCCSLCVNKLHSTGNELPWPCLKVGLIKALNNCFHVSVSCSLLGLLGWVEKERRYVVKGNTQRRNFTFTSEVQNQVFPPRHRREKKLCMAKILQGKKHSEGVQRNSRNWTIILKYVENHLLFISEFAIFNHL